jgi:hypothetical protein
MMIHRDGLMASPYGSAQNYEKILSARNAPPSAGYSMNPLQQREAMQKIAFEQRRSELLTKATGEPSHSTQWVAKNWLTVCCPSSSGHISLISPQYVDRCCYNSRLTRIEAPRKKPVSWQSVLRSNSKPTGREALAIPIYSA